MNDAAGKSGASERIHSIILRPWPKVIFLYPSLMAAIVAGVWQLWLKDDNPARDTVGLVFFIVFCANLLVISFEYTRIKTVAIFFLALAVVFLLMFLGTKWEVMAGLKEIIDNLNITASTSFYFAIAVYLAAIYVGVYINTRWNYWEIRHNELIHHTGFLGDIKRYPSPNLRMTKVINDVFEFLLLGSGRIVLYPASEREAIVLENVLAVNKAENSLKRLLSTLAVEITSHAEIRPEEH
jgi:hypothetical protein